MDNQSRRSLQTYTFDQWKDIIATWATSGLSKADFCKQQKLTRSTFCFWERRVASPDSFQTKARAKYTPEQRKSLIEEWEKSGLSKHAYCLQKNLTPSAFNSWISNPELQEPSLPLKDQDVKSSSCIASDSPEAPKENPATFFQEHFVSVPLDSSMSAHASSSNQKIEVVFAEGHRLCLQGPFDLELLGSWLIPLLNKQDTQQRVDHYGNQN